MSKRSPSLLIEDMLDAVDRVNRYTEGYDYKRFVIDERTIDAVVRNLEIIGEAAARLPDEVKSTSRNIEWRKIIGLRNRIVHDYFGIDLEIVWYIIKNDIPQFKIAIESLNKG